MKIIKYRFYDSEVKRMVYSEEWDWPSQAERLVHFFGHVNRYSSESPQQFTGLLDSEGREIYEGDIVTWDDASNGKYWRVAKVIWHERGSWAFSIIPNKSINCYSHGRTYDFMLGNFIYSPDTSLHGNVLKVIGNVFENPELA